MPFSPQASKPFTRAAIDALPDNVQGCYGLFVNQGKWIYVGRGDIKIRLLAHLNGDNPCITRNKPTHFMIQVAVLAETLEKQLILELTPVCNQKVG
jgi:hypothetical protein